MNKKELLAKWGKLTGSYFAEGEIPTNKELEEMIKIEEMGNAEDTMPIHSDSNVDDSIKKDQDDRKVTVKGKSEALPEKLKVIKNKNGFFIETIGQGWVKLTKGQLLRLAELISE